jgi:hypothetical protein
VTALHLIFAIILWSLKVEIPEETPVNFDAHPNKSIYTLHGSAGQEENLKI